MTTTLCCHDNPTTDLLLPKVIGHRGAAGHAPENTLASFATAQRLGLSWVEFDIQMTACDTLVVIHDLSVNRTSNGRGRVSRALYQELALLDAGSWFNISFASEQIPTLQQVIHYLGQAQLNANIELKTSAKIAEKVVPKLLSLLREAWPAWLAPPLLSSFCQKTLAVLQQHNCPWPVGLLLDGWSKHWQQLLVELACTNLHIHHRSLTAERVAQVKLAGYNLLAYTVNDNKRAEQLFAWGVDAIFSDYPDRISSRLVK